MKRMLRIWLMTSNYNKELPIFTKTFQKLEKELNIKIDFKIVTWVRVYERLIEAFKNGEGPDIFALGSTWVSVFQNLGYLDEVPSSFHKRKNLAEWADGCGLFDGKYYSMPWYIEPLVLLGNEELITKYYGQVDELVNWEEFKNICDRIYYNANINANAESTHVPFSFMAKSGMMTIHYFTALLYKKGFSYPEVQQAQHRFINLEEFLDTFRYIIDLVSYEVFDISDPNVYAKFLLDKFYKKEQGSFLLDVPTLIASETLSALREKKEVCHPYKIYSIPFQKENQPTWAGGGFLNVSSASQFKEEAWAIVDSLLKEEFIEDWCAASGYMPAFECELWEKYGSNHFISSLKKEIINSRNYPFHPLWRNIELILFDGLLKLFWQFWYKRDKLKDEMIIQIEKDMNEKISKMLSLTWEMR